MTALNMQYYEGGNKRGWRKFFSEEPADLVLFARYRLRRLKQGE
jgi:hypothetical protein